MKKFFSLFAIFSILSYTMPTLVAANIYEVHNARGLEKTKLKQNLRINDMLRE